MSTAPAAAPCGRGGSGRGGGAAGVPGRRLRGPGTGRRAYDSGPDIDEPDHGDAEAASRPAIHLPLADPYQAPEGYSIKANTHSGLYYTPESALYDHTVPEVWFASEELAQANGFVKAPE